MRIQENPYISALAKLRSRMEAAAQRSPLSAAKPPRIVGASKQQPVETLEQAIAAGLVAFGENRVQEALGKWPALKKGFPHVRLHLIGPLQTNKVKEAVELFDVIETLDREKLCDALAAEMKKQNRFPKIFVQVNTGEEEQKAGVHPLHADALIAYARAKDLEIAGLMCVPPAKENPAPHFALLHEIAKRNNIAELSMGMSEDFETAVRFGATQVRLGRILFGERK